MRWLTGSDGLAVTEEAAQAKEQRWESEASIMEGKEKMRRCKLHFAKQ